MDAEIKAKWVKALRSGEYKQGAGQLRDGKGAMCCLGVLYDIQGGEWSPDMSVVTNDLPRGFNARIPSKKRRLLSCMNDGSYNHDVGKNIEKRTFPQIADYIEENL